MIFLRQDLLSGEWVGLNADRQERPLTEATSCPFCPGEKTEVGNVPFDVAVFENKFPAFQSPGSAEVVVYSPRHEDDLAYLPRDNAQLVWQAWKDRSQSLEERADVQSVFIFENRGGKVGASIAHPHGQIYAYPFLPPRLERERVRFESNCPLCARNDQESLVLFENRLWRIEVPYAMRMPFQLWLFPSRHVPRLKELTPDEMTSGAALMQDIVRSYDSYFGLRTALVMALYQDVSMGSAYHMRWDFLPIDRGQGKTKYLAGSELAMGAFVVDMIPEFVKKELTPVWDRIHHG
ncbi:MAG: DUF4931 domain-containing protein [Firmicutes bacterium]|jgi:UDPglucose--hexose-1-phosphate uridylyltransferase|uniref:Galactose-1-phosphate uridylyltransferase n=1 Tax=Sulfobacillus benefaciens TaxID=453960 RepID=A0A2T2WRV4_9FIRM|nr:DUF4931 domain-containing protein [Bacillota bacterium]MCL5015908.1 DUF4931 domain-containing protein [Bacillota bacterium]PSR24972.1 MAG: hypothetical protein C7B43_17820 [Sulfobacillus benefaciens]